MPHQQQLENGEFERICNNLENIQKRQDNNKAINSKCPVKVEQENGMQMAKHTSILGSAQVVHTEQTQDIFLSNQRSVDHCNHTPGLQCDQTENKVRNQTFCTSDKILHKDWKSFKLFYTNGLKGMENSALDILDAEEQTTSLVKLQDEDATQQQHYIFQASHYEMENETGNVCVGMTADATIQNKDMALTANDTPAGGSNKPHFVKQCW